MASSDELIGFVREALSRGVPRADVQEALVRAGWNADQVDGALAGFAAIDFPIPVPRPRSTTSAREAFFYLLLFSTLHVAAFSLGVLIFAFIERVYPDPTSLMSLVEFRSVLRWTVSGMVVSVPVFLYVTWLTSRATDRDPRQRVSPVGRWLMYVMLFEAACLLIGDVARLVYNVLGGELTVRFGLKVATIGMIAGGIFWYFLGDARAVETEGRR